MAYNSTIKQKIGFCLDCPEDAGTKYLIAKRCQFHYQIFRSKLNSSKQKLQTEIRKLIVHDNDIDQPIWFQEKIEILRLNPVCSECGAPVPDRYNKEGEEVVTDKFLKAAVAHIFPKSIFPSVAVHPFNYVFAAAGCGCHNLTHRMDTFSKMKIFPVAIDRYMMFKDEIMEKHTYKSLFEEAVKNYYK